jgi:hypothetical protein
LREERRRLLESPTHLIEQQMKEYAEDFLRAEYGEEALKKLAMVHITALNAYEVGGISEATDTDVKLAVKRDVYAGRLTETTKLVLRHELGHVLDDSSPMFPEFEEEIAHEKIAWVKAKPKNAAERWYRNVSIRTHLDPLKMQCIGFPNPKTKLTPELLQRGTTFEIERMRNSSVWVDEILAKRYAMAHLIENPNYYSQKP